jgi:hypothetical protein
MEGHCAEAKYCAHRLLYDAPGADIQLRMFGGKLAPLGHQKAIKCGQCVCQDCPVRMWLDARNLGAGSPILVLCRTVLWV